MVITIQSIMFMQKILNIICFYLFVLLEFLLELGSTNNSHYLIMYNLLTIVYISKNMFYAFFSIWHYNCNPRPFPCYINYFTLLYLTPLY